VTAVDGVDLTLHRGDILGLIGPNGAGKTTLVNALSGFARPTEGSLRLGAHDVTKWRPPRLARAGLTRTFQDIRLFAHLSTRENVECGAVSVRMPPKEASSWTDELLERMGLDQYASRFAGTLPHGDQRRLAIARALATRPAFLLLDEPTAGLTEPETDALIETLRSNVTDLNCGVLVIEHDMRMIMGVCDRIQVLDNGRTIALDTPAAIRSDPAVVAAYFRTGGDSAPG
jgi:branched-chain amino acid transport system ATP-binding protein